MAVLPMTDKSKHLMLYHSDSDRRNLIEEYITRQKAEFTYKVISS